MEKFMEEEHSFEEYTEVTNQVLTNAVDLFFP